MRPSYRYCPGDTVLKNVSKELSKIKRVSPVVREFAKYHINKQFVQEVEFRVYIDRPLVITSNLHMKTGEKLNKIYAGLHNTKEKVGHNSSSSRKFSNFTQQNHDSNYLTRCDFL